MFVFRNFNYALEKVILSQYFLKEKRQMGEKRVLAKINAGCTELWLKAVDGVSSPPNTEIWSCFAAHPMEGFSGNDKVCKVVIARQAQAIDVILTSVECQKYCIDCWDLLVDFKHILTF